MTWTLVLPHEVTERLRSVKKTLSDDEGHLSVLDWRLSWCCCQIIES